MCIVFSIYLVMWQLSFQLQGLLISQGLVRKVFLLEIIDIIDFQFDILLVGCFSVGGSRVVKWWLVVIVDELIGYVVKCLGSLWRVVVILFSFGNIGFSFVWGFIFVWYSICLIVLQMCVVVESFFFVSEMKVFVGSLIKVYSNLFMLRWGRICILLFCFLCLSFCN